jgi:hypothetical protein
VTISVVFLRPYLKLKLVDLEHGKLFPRWRGPFFSVRRSSIQSFSLQSWVSSSGLSDHLPIIFQMDSSLAKPPAPFNFNPIWLRDKDFKELIKGKWIPLLAGSPSSYMHITRLKQAMKGWNKKFKERMQAKHLCTMYIYVHTYVCVHIIHVSID